MSERARRGRAPPGDPDRLAIGPERGRQGIAGEPQVAVLVQALVPAEVAGVLFTRDPLAAASGQQVVEATWGLGEAVVAGLVTPDHYVLSGSGEVIERQLGQKDLVILPDGDSGTREESIDATELGAGACLEDDMLRRIAGLGARCEALFGPGQDIEWAVAGGAVYLLQARPITR